MQHLPNDKKEDPSPSLHPCIYFADVVLSDDVLKRSRPSDDGDELKLWEEDERLKRKYMQVGCTDDLSQHSIECMNNPDIISWNIGAVLSSSPSNRDTFRDIDKCLTKYNLGIMLNDFRRNMKGLKDEVRFFAISNQDKIELIKVLIIIVSYYQE